MHIVIPEVVVHHPSFVPASSTSSLKFRIFDETLKQCRVQRCFGYGAPFWDKDKRQGRFGDSGVEYSYKGKAKPVHAMTPALNGVRDLVNKKLGEAFNCVVVNYYLTGRASLYPHTDITYIPQLGDEPTIAAVSFGATRTFVLTSMADKKKKVEVSLSDGDLLVMSGRSQLDWKHGVPREEEVVGDRVSLTFRVHPLV